MTLLDTSPAFAAAFERLASVSLNPRRHTASSAREHSLEVSRMARALAAQNGKSEADVALLSDLGLCHDIGKITGTAAPARSLDVLADCAIDAGSHPRLLPLVKWHDTNLPWWRAAGRGQAPSDKAWRRLTGAVDIDLLCLFMVADRVDTPGGWLRNAPLRWFLAEARRRDLVGELELHVDGHPSEVSAGGVLVSDGRALVIRVREDGYEVPKGGIEFDELPGEAAVRETREEAGVVGPLEVGRSLGSLTYSVGRGADAHGKRVEYFALSGEPRLEDAPAEIRWITADEVSELPWVNPALRDVVGRALA